MSEKYPLSLNQIEERLEKYTIPEVDAVLGIGRGGIFPSKLVSKKIGKPLFTLWVNYRNDRNQPQRSFPEVLSKVEISLKKGSKILLVDDVAVTGATLNRVKSVLKDYDVTTFVFKGKADHVLFPEITTCISWPWNIAETVSSVSNPDKRRGFLKTLAGITAGVMMPFPGNLVANSILEGQHKISFEKDRFGELLPQRKFGNTGINLPMLGLGGAHIARMSEKEAQKTIETALEGGVRFFDNAESYGNGLAEKRYGMFLTPKYRDVAFIQSKSTARDGRTARAHLEGSLKRMNTDYLDLWFIHAVSSPKDVDNRIKNGVLDVVLEAQQSGKVKYIGFSGHSDYKAHLRMLERTNDLQVCQMPINVFDPNYKSFINNVFPKLIEKNMATVAMKTLSNGGFFGGTSHFLHGDKPKIVPNVLSIQEALYFSWSLPISVLVTGADHAQMLQEKIELAKAFKAMDEQKRMELVEKVSGFDGRFVEYYKV
jgi:predicted aldo/keto reductase-like oxidoreductase/hypoxanthine phosphoribosyltransferase